MTDNRRYIINIFSLAMTLTGFSTVPPVIASVVFKEALAGYTLTAAMIICIVTGIVLRSFRGRISGDIRPRVMLMSVVFTWFLMIAISSLVFYFAASGISVADAFMESCASWTGTAAYSSLWECTPSLWESPGS